jgi:transcriptional regulator with XRE-family HTH domain
MPQKRIPLEKVSEIKELRQNGYTYRQIHRETGVSTGKIADICEKERPITTLNLMEKKVSGLDKSILEFEKQFIAIRDRVIEDIISSDQELVCPNCTSEFMTFEDDRTPYMNCSSCDYVLVFGKL